MSSVMFLHMLLTFVICLSSIQLPGYYCYPTTTQTLKGGCFYEGKFYNFNENINQGYDAVRNWCWWTYCDSYGYVVAGDNFNCKTKRTTTGPPSTAPSTPTSTIKKLTTTTPSTTPTTKFTTPVGCYYDGKYYYPGEEISRGYDASSNWCYGSFCDDSMQITYWDDFNCVKTTTATTTTPPDTICSTKASI